MFAHTWNINMAQKTVRAVLIEDNARFAVEFKRDLLSSASVSIDLVRFDTLDAALGHLPSNQRTEIIFLSLTLVDGQELETIAKLRERAPHASLIVLSRPDEESLALGTLQMGAQDYLLRGECQQRALARIVRYALERKRAQDELREQREFSRLISRNVTDMIMVLDREGRRVYHSPSYRSILGDLEAAKGRTTFNEVHPEDRRHVQQSLRETLATGSGRRLEYRLQLQAGGTRFMESQASVIKDRWGKPFKLVVVSRDITERRLSEQALRESEQRYKHLISSITDYIFIVTVRDGHSVSTAHGPGCEALTGYTPEDFDADPQLWLGMVPDEDRAMVLAQVQRLLRGELAPPIEHRILRKSGEVRWIRNTSVPRKDATGRLIAYDGLLSDITERKMAEERLKHAYAELARSEEALRKTLDDLKSTQLQLIQAEKFESIGTLAAGVAHEVKNPLQTILMGLAYLERNLPQENETLRMVITDVRDAVKRADTIVRELLTLAAATQITMKDEDFNQVVERSLWLVNYELNATHITAVRNLTPALPPVRMDRSRLEQVLINLFLNAIQAMRNGGTLTVSTRFDQWSDALPRSEKFAFQFTPGEPVVVAEIRDTGIGIPEKNLARIFDPFFTTKPAGSGTGLGLAVARQIIELHGGLIAVRNAASGGVAVTLVLRAQAQP